MTTYTMTQLAKEAALGRKAVKAANNSARIYFDEPKLHIDGANVCLSIPYAIGRDGENPTFSAYNIAI